MVHRLLLRGVAGRPTLRQNRVGRGRIQTVRSARRPNAYGNGWIISIGMSHGGRDGDVRCMKTR